MERRCSFILLSCLFAVGIWSCAEPEPEASPQFKKLDATVTGIDFTNELTESDSLNYFTYGYIYMGGGIAAGDINNDGLVDLYFTGNMVPNRLYLNKGGMQFEDISESAGVAGDDRWYTGVTMADVNADGLLDIYCSVGGLYGSRENQLFINQGDATFRDATADYGLGDIGNSVQATFFDYDKDGDLDMYQANYPPTPFDAPNQHYLLKMRYAKPEETDKLYRNDGDRFTDVSEEAGLATFGLSLSATVADVNNDGWPDIYVSNDFSSPDYLFLNKKDGTFYEAVRAVTRNTSFYGMGVDIADFNNDGLLDIFQVDMTAEDNRRSKANMASMNPDLFWSTVNSGFHYQYMQNSLQLNNGNLRDTLPDFSNISRLAGVSSTDWSWGPLLADLDNDGWKDIYVTNGTRREINNRDFFLAWDAEGRPLDRLLERTLEIPSEPLDNYAYRNNGDMTFQRVNKDWGIEIEGFSNGSIYADLDNDGDLEIVTNNIDAPATVFQNQNASGHNYLKLQLAGNTLNPFGLGSRVTVYAGETKQVQELTLTRGFQSAVAPEIHFGLGQNNSIDSLVIQWTDGRMETQYGLQANQTLQLNYANSMMEAERTLTQVVKLFQPATPQNTYRHLENEYNDYFKEILLPHQTSMLGPDIDVGDINGDGLDDFVVGNAAIYPTGVYVQRSDGFERLVPDWIRSHSRYEDLGVHLFDADQDGDKDLYIVSGGNEFPKGTPQLQDRLYLNDGLGRFTYAASALPSITDSGSRVHSHDFDGDGDLDLFVGGRLVPGSYPAPAKSYILENRSSGGEVRFADVTREKAPTLLQAGMVTDARWTDYNGDGKSDLIITGEWMPITVLEYDGEVFENKTQDLKLQDTAGWWFSLEEGDFDGDGDMDFIVGNLGLNYKYQANEAASFDIYYNDFDRSGSNDIVLSYFNAGKEYPLRGRECSSQQMPGIKKKFENYASFSTATLEDVYTKKMLEEALHYQVKSFASAYIENDNGELTIKPLPMAAQTSSIHQILVDDFDQDGFLDAVVAGNLHMAEVETPRNDAGIGLFLKGTGDGSFTVVEARHSGLYAPGDIKDAATISIDGQKHLVFAKNSDSLQFVRVNQNITRKLAALKPLQ